MTDRVRSITVALSRDMREDDVEYLVNLIGSLKNVEMITTNIVGGNEWATEERVRRELRDKLFKVLEPSCK